MNFRLHKNCVCQKFIEELNNLPEETPENEEIIDARRMNSFRGSRARLGSQRCGRHMGRH